ncbi:multidrug resistance-associated protein 5 [Tanacetum coccineum]
MILGADLHQFDVYSDGYFAHLPLTYVDGGLLLSRLTLYLDHLVMNLSEYLSQAITYDMDDMVSKKIGPPKKRYCNDFFIDEMVDWAEMEVETEGVEARTSTTEGVEARNSTTEGVEDRTSTKDKGKEKVSEDASYVVETRRCTVKIDSETEYESDDDSDYQSDKKAKAKAKDKPDSEMNEPNEENSMPADNVRGETFKEQDIYINELLKSLKTADKDRITEDPFISVGEKYTSVAQFKECLTYYALANGFSLWHERSEEERVVAKCGQRPPKVSAPEKGKQRKQTKYPYASSDALPKCPWRCYARWMTAEKTFQCISLVDEHTCVRNFNFGALVNYSQLITNHCRFWHVIPADGKLFEVRSRSEGFTVDKGYLRVMSQLGLKDIMYSTVLPPKPRKMPGRPKKKRIRATDECCSSTRVSKVGSQGSCSNCKQHGHNKSSCKEPVVEQTPKPKGVVGLEKAAPVE